MTTTPTEKPLALQLAKNLIQIHQSHADEGDTTFSESAAELERQNAEIDRLTAENEALRAVVAEAVAAERERLCAAIKAADDKASDDDYMLDSDDCISVIRGTWNSV